MVDKFKGILKRFYKRDEKTGLSLFGVETEEIDVVRNMDGLVRCEGIVPKWPVETGLILNGTWDDKTYCVSSAKPYAETKEMSTKLLKQIVKELKAEEEDFRFSAANIKKLIDLLNGDILSISDRSDSLERLKGWFPKVEDEILEKIIGKVLEINETYSILDFLSKFGGTIANCQKLISSYGKNALLILKKKPYEAGYASGIDFFVCDKIARYLGEPPYSKNRIRALIYEALREVLERNSSTYTEHLALSKQVLRVTKKSSYPEAEITGPEIAAMIQDMKGIKIECRGTEVRIYDKKLYNCERTIASNLRRLNIKKRQAKYNDTCIDEAEKFLGITYSEKQREAFSLLKTSGVKVVTGGPGTGKTTVINGIIHVYKTINPANEVALCAPTGRAAQRMHEVTELDAATIHRTIGYMPYGMRKVKYKNFDDPLEADLVIIDEMSMVDTEIFSLILPAIKKGSTLILIGDEDQLQSVAAGKILQDIIESNQFETYRLKEVFRQKGDNTIIDNAYKILEGNMNLTSNAAFEMYPCNSDDEAKDTLMNIINDFRKKGDVTHMQILSPVKVGDIGTYNINRIVSEDMNAETEAEDTFCHGKVVYHKNDKVIFLKNRYEKGYCNGDIGYITKVIPNGLIVQVGENDIRVTGDSLNDITLAYAITIHKSQGSENDSIVIVLPDAYASMLDRNMLFTAVTRAKNEIKIIYVNNAFSDSVHTIRKNKRLTGLTEKLCG